MVSNNIKTIIFLKRYISKINLCNFLSHMQDLEISIHQLIQAPMEYLSHTHLRITYFLKTNDHPWFIACKLSLSLSFYYSKHNFATNKKKLHRMYGIKFFTSVPHIISHTDLVEFEHPVEKTTISRDNNWDSLHIIWGSKKPIQHL